MDGRVQTGAISPTQAWLAELHATYRGLADGAVATYIPELANANPAHFGICLATVDGKSYAVGDCNVAFTIQSISKPFVFGLALQDHGRDHVLTKVGVEPTGDAFNSITFDKETNRPLNPMVNAGAIACAGMVGGNGLGARAARIRRFLGSFAGRPLELDEAVFRSERETGHRNRAIAHMERNFGILDERVEEHVDLYFMQCSILVTARDLAMMAATLANGGVNPVTGERCLDEENVKYVLAVMSTCGMYDYAGEWLYRIGLPAKSGVGGGIIAVLPGQFGIATFSPPLDAHGNSVRGLKVFEDLSHSFDLHMFDPPSTTRSAVVRQFRGDKVHSERVRGPHEAAVLKSAAAAIAVYELQGDLILASVEQLARRIDDDGRPARCVIIDFHRVWRIGAAAAMLIARIIVAQRALGHAVLLAGIAEGDDRKLRLLQSGVAPDAFHDNLDTALENAEDALLAQSGAAAGHLPAMAPEQMDILAGLTPVQLANVTARMRPLDFPTGDVVFREGDVADHLYFLLSGAASIFVTTDNGTERRLASISTGATFGEMAAFDGKPRSASVRADTAIACLALGIADLTALSHADPPAYGTIQANIVRILIARLRHADERLRALR